MDLKQAFAKALRQSRVAKKLTQEDFSIVSSRTYLSTLERGIKGPSLEKLDVIAKRLEIHPASLVVLTYLQHDNSPSLEELLDVISVEVLELGGD